MRYLRLLPALLVLSAAGLHAQTLSYQGQLTENGQPANGSYNLTFALYDAETGGTALWTETFNGATAVTVTGGVYQVQLGSLNPLPDGFHAPRWLGIAINGNPELVPRTPLSAVPQALSLALPFQAVADIPTDMDMLYLEDTSPDGQGNVISVIGGRDGFSSLDAEDDGLEINSAGNDGIFINGSGDDGVQIFNSGDDGIYIENISDDGVQIFNSGDDGIEISHTGGTGIRLNNISSNGLFVQAAGANGVHVLDADQNGIRVDNAALYSLDIQGVRDGSASSPMSHIAHLYNRHTSSGSDVLALKVGRTTNPTTGNNFVTFYNGNDTILGEIQGNGSGGVSFNSAGSDYAEYLPHLAPGGGFTAGDVVGVFGGHISHRTQGADAVLVVTDQPAVLGNRPHDQAGHEAVSFIGQVRVRVRGGAKAGDWIVASGREDGTAIARGPDALQPGDQVVGRAWATVPGAGVVAVNTAVGLDAATTLLARQQGRLEALEARLAALERNLGSH